MSSLASEWSRSQRCGLCGVCACNNFVLRVSVAADKGRGVKYGGHGEAGVWRKSAEQRSHGATGLLRDSIAGPKEDSYLLLSCKAPSGDQIRMFLVDNRQQNHAAMLTRRRPGKLLMKAQ